MKFSITSPFFTLEYSPDQPFSDHSSPRLFSEVKTLQNNVVNHMHSEALLLARQDLLSLSGLVFPPGRREKGIVLAQKLKRLHEDKRDRGDSQKLRRREDALLTEVVNCVNDFAALALMAPARPEFRAPGPVTSGTEITSAPVVGGAHGRGLPSVKATEASVKRGARTVLSGVNLSTYPGEFIAVVGQNGAGKTTLLEGLARQSELASGVIDYPAIEAQFGPGRPALNQVHFVPEQPARWSGRVLDALLMFGQLQGIPQDDNRDQVVWILERLDMWRYRDYKFEELSMGYRTRFELARAMLKFPKVLILDEPLGPLDLTARGWYLQLLGDLTRSMAWNWTVVLSGQEDDVAGIRR